MAPKAADKASNAAPTETAVTPINQAAKDLETATTPVRKEAPGVTKRTSGYSLDARTIMRREGWNNRFDFGDIEGLAASMLVNGMLTPLRVKRLATPVQVNGPMGFYYFELIDGDRRLTAVELLIKQGKYAQAFPDGVPAIIVDKNQDDKTSLIQMFEANRYKSLLPLEEAAAYSRMRTEYKMTLKQICEATGRKQVHVSEMLNLLTATPELQEAVASGAVGKTDAKKIATVAKNNPEAQRQLTQQAKTANSTTKGKGGKNAVKDAIRKTHQTEAAKRGKKLKIRALSDAQLSDIGSKMAEHLMGLLEAMDIPVDSDLVGMIRKDPKLTMAYTTGALDALKVAAGGDNNLKL